MIKVYLKKDTSKEVNFGELLFENKSYFIIHSNSTKYMKKTYCYVKII